MKIAASPNMHFALYENPEMANHHRRAILRLRLPVTTSNPNNHDPRAARLATRSGERATATI